MSRTGLAILRFRRVRQPGLPGSRPPGLMPVSSELVFLIGVRAAQRRPGTGANGAVFLCRCASVHLCEISADLTAGEIDSPARCVVIPTRSTSHAAVATSPTRNPTR